MNVVRSQRDSDNVHLSVYIFYYSCTLNMCIESASTYMGVFGDVAYKSSDHPSFASPPVSYPARVAKFGGSGTSAFARSELRRPTSSCPPSIIVFRALTVVDEAFCQKERRRESREGDGNKPVSSVVLYSHTVLPRTAVWLEDYHAPLSHT